MGAILDPARRYRYFLDRIVDPLADTIDRKTVTFVMLNPSIADETKPDPTMTRCVGYTLREGGTHLQIVNLFALRSPRPRALAVELDPVGGYANDQHIRLALADSHLVILGWGVNVPRPLRYRRREVFNMVLAAGHEPLCLEVTKSGEPGHPLMLKLEAPLVPWHWCD